MRSEDLAPQVEGLVQRIATLETQATRVSALHVLERVVTLLLAGVIGYTAWNGLPIHYIYEGGPGYSKPGELPRDMARNVAERFAIARYTYMYGTFKEQMEDCLRWVHPEIHVRFRSDLEQEEREVKKYQMSTQTYFKHFSVQKGNADTALVILTGMRGVWVGETYREEVVKAEITLVPLRPKGNIWEIGPQQRPGQLVVARSHFTPVLRAAQP